MFLAMELVFHKVMLNSPVIVIGPPRSGTTITAKVLQHWLGIAMDSMPMRPDKVINPHGWYEDMRLVRMNSLFLDGTINLRAWRRRFRTYIRQMKKQNRPWGFKDPRIIPMLGHALTYFESPTLVRCCRPKELVVESMMGKLGWTEEVAKKRYEADNKQLDWIIGNRPHFRLDFGEYITEEEILEFFKGAMVLRYGT